MHLDMLGALGSVIALGIDHLHATRRDATKPFSGRCEAILKQIEHPMPSNK
jgi:hypothetical protein